MNQSPQRVAVSGPLPRIHYRGDSMANVAYVRVSTAEQHEDRQISALEPYKIDKWFREKISGKNTERPEFRRMMEYVREGDTVYVEDFSRLSRSVADLLRITADFQRRKIGLVSLKERLDSSTPQGRLMLTMIAAINEFERANILERQAEGIELAKQKGIYKGRKRIEKPANWQDVYSRWKRREITGAQAMQESGLKRNTFYSFVHGEEAADNG